MIYVIGATKGGVGKTTIAVNLAAIDVTSGHDSLLVDADKQGSASAWAEVRDTQEIGRVTCVQKLGKSLVNDLRELHTKYENVFVDVGGHDSAEMRSAMVVADLLLIPVRPSQFDVWGLPHLIEMIEEVQHINPGLKYAFVVNAAHTNANVKDAEELSELLADLPVLNTVLHNRRAYTKSPVLGMSVVELADKDPKAIEEMMSLYEEVMCYGKS